MRRGALALVTALVLVTLAIGGAIAAVGGGDLKVFSKDTGTLEDRITTVEDFLVGNSPAVKDKIARMQGEIDALKADMVRAVCPTSAEEKYLEAHAEELTAFEEALVEWAKAFSSDDELTLDDVKVQFDKHAAAIREALQNIVVLAPPVSPRAEKLHDATVAMSEKVLEGLDAFEEASTTWIWTKSTKAYGFLVTPQQITRLLTSQSIVLRRSADFDEWIFSYAINYTYIIRELARQSGADWGITKPR